MPSIEGLVTIAQESRFQLTDDLGVSLLFLLHHGAAIEPSQLAPLQARQQRVRVEYDTTPTVLARVARSVEPCAGA